MMFKANLFDDRVKVDTPPGYINLNDVFNWCRKRKHFEEILLKGRMNNCDYLWLMSRDVFDSLVYDFQCDPYFYNNFVTNRKLMGIDVKILDSACLTIRMEKFREEPDSLYPKFILDNIDATMELFKKRGMEELYKMRCGLTMKIKKVIFNDPATIVIWEDNTKTIVQSQGEKFDPEKGLAMAISKRALGGQGGYYDIFKKWVPEKYITRKKKKNATKKKETK